jgi:hypothetical protein
VTTLDEEAPFDPEARALCPDGACIGVVGADGRCKVCGRAAGERAPDEERWISRPVEVAEAAPPDEDAGAPDDDRRLCPDDACIGLLGADGRCKVCGRSA